MNRGNTEILSCRPFVLFAIVATAGVLAVRAWPPLSKGCVWGIAAIMLFFVCNVYTAYIEKNNPVPLPLTLPPSYAPHILPQPNLFARIGSSRCIIIFAFFIFFVAAWRQQTWRQSLSLDNMPKKRWFNARFRALAPSHEFAGERGWWRIPAEMLEADGKQIRPLVIRLSGPDEAEFKRGDILTTRVRQEWIKIKAYPDAFDYQSWLEQNGMGAVLSIDRKYAPKGSSYLVSIDQNTEVLMQIRAFCDTIRASAIAQTLKYGGRHGPLFAAMLFGYRKMLDSALRDTFRRIGIGHVLAISGLHVGLIIALVWQALGFVGLHSRIRACICIAVSVCYLGLCGAQTAPARATLMAIIHLSGIAIGRQSDMLNSLAVAAIVIIFVNPSAPLDIGFLLSFTSVLFIYLSSVQAPGRSLLVNLLSRIPLPWLTSRFWRNAASLIYLSAGTWIGLFPIIAAVFHQVNLIGIPINIIVIPLMSVVLACGLLVPLLGWIQGVSWFLCLPSDLLACIARIADALPGASFPIHSPSGIWIFFFYLSTAFLLCRGLFVQIRRSELIIFGIYILTTVSLLGTALSSGSHLPPGGGRLTLLPGREMNIIVAEAENGSLALLGPITRGGSAEAEWLHSLHRSGTVSVITQRTFSKDGLGALDYHYPIKSVINLSRKNFTGKTFLPWMSVPDAPGIEYSAGYDSKGKILWLAARTGTHTICATRNITLDDLKNPDVFPVSEIDPDLLHIILSEQNTTPLFLPEIQGCVAISARGRQWPDRWFSRWKYGALMLENENIIGFDGHTWEKIAQIINARDL